VPRTLVAQELEMLLRIARAAGVRPLVGVRAKLSTRHEGHWGSTSGEKAKFGLRPREIVAVVSQLAALGMADCLTLLHFHIGSQARNPPTTPPDLSCGYSHPFLLPHTQA
jgi:arginine decarboxylase-like protein